MTEQVTQQELEDLKEQVDRHQVALEGICEGIILLLEALSEFVQIMEKANGSK